MYLGKGISQESACPFSFVGETYGKHEKRSAEGTETILSFRGVAKVSA